jgi:exosortase D (VPLPA-CTERM-specific)
MKNKDNLKTLLPFIVAAVLGLGVVLIYLPVLLNLVNRLAGDEDYSYGLLLPLVSAYIVYLKWSQIRRYRWEPSWWGVPVVILGFILLTAGKLVADPYSPPFSFTVVITGFLLLLGGWGIIRMLSFPLVLLVLMLPLPGIITNFLTFPLQLISSRLAAGFLRGLGIPLVLQGNILDLGVRQLQVVSACSGLRYILALLALGIIFCYFYQRRFWKAAVLILALVPAAILANATRVAAMGLFPALQEGFWHSFSGWLIFVFCFVSMALLNWFLNYLRPAPQAVVEAEAEGPHPEMPSVTPRASYYPSLLVALVLVAGGGLLSLKIAEPPRIPLLQSLDHFPLQLGSWQGRRTYIDPEIFQKTEADSYVDADFSSPGQEPVSLYLAHYEIQGGAGGLGHNPGACMTGTGWTTLDSGSTEIAPGYPVNYLLLERSNQRLLVYYWNIHQGQWLALSSDRRYKLYSLYNALRNHRTDWALVRLITPVNQDLAAARERLTAFAQLVTPVLPQFIKAERVFKPKN